MRFSAAGLVFGVLVTGSAHAQYVISAHSGMVQYVEGQALLNDSQVEPKSGQFPEIKENQVFRTEEGRAEILLTPGVFLRLGENSSMRMISNRLTDTRVEILSGSAMVECDDLAKDNSIMLLYKGNTMLLVKHGLYRLDTNPALFQVYDGEAIVKGESGQLTLKHGKQTALDGVLMAENFDTKLGDDLYRWSSRRSGYLAKANVSSAMGLRGYGSTWGSSGWLWNSMFGMYTFVPYRGICYSPFGYSFWSPYTVGQAYYYYAPSYSGGSSNGSRSFSAGSQYGYTPGGRDSGSSASYSGGSYSSAGGGARSSGGVATSGGGGGGGAVSAGGGGGRGSGGGGGGGRGH